MSLGKHYKRVIVTVLTFVCASLTYYSHFMLRTDVVFSHLFYIPIALAGFWWGKRGILIPILLGGWLVISHALSVLPVPFRLDLIRFFMFTTVGLVVSTLREQTLKGEQALKETRNYLNSLIHCANAPIMVWDKQGKISLFNNAFERLTGYKAQEVIGKSPNILFTQASKEESLKKFEQTLKGEQLVSLEVPICCKDGKERILLCNLANIYAQDGKTQVATIVHAQDITLRKQATEALHIQMKELEEDKQTAESSLAQRIKELGAYKRITDAMLETLDLERRLENALKEILDITGGEKTGVGLREDDRLIIKKQFGFSETFMAWAGDLAIEDIPSVSKITIGWHSLPDPSSRLEIALKKEGIKSWVIVPLKLKKEFLGILILASERPNAFSREQINMLSTLTNSLTFMLQHAHLYRTAQERLARLTTLREIDMAISANLSMEGIIKVVLEKISPHIWVDAVGISLMDWGQKRTILARTHLPGDVSIEGEAFGLSDSLLYQLGVEKKPVIIYDVKSDPRLQNHRNIIRKYNLCSYIGVPLVVQDKPIGVLHLLTTQPKEFSKEDMNFFTTLAGQAAISVQNARLYEEAKKRAQNMEVLADVTFNFAQLGEEVDLAKQALPSACRVVGAKMGILWWYDELKNTLEILAMVGISQEKIGTIISCSDPSSSPLALAAVSKKPIYIPDLNKEPILEGLPIGSAYIVPLIYYQRFFGIYCFLSRRKDGFTSEQRNLADVFSSHVSSAIENARLFKETQRAYQELKTTQEQLIQAQKMEAIGRLAGGVAHDFNNLLTGIQGFTELSLMKIKEHDPVYQDIKEIHRCALQAASLTRQLLLFSRKQPMDMKPIDLNITIQNMTKMLNRLIGENISLKTELIDGLWPTETDPGNIEQVIMNLVINARDAMPEGGEILISTQNIHIDESYLKIQPEARCGNFICLSVKDTGIGMDQKTLKHIFEPFFTTKEPGIGTGLGLSVVYGIVKQHQGWIEVESFKGQGTTFRVYLPAIPLRPIKDEESLVSLEAFKGQGERILLIEDDTAVREFTERGLSENGYIVFACATAQEALDIFERKQGDFDLILTDLILPDKKGTQLAEHILKVKPQSKMLFISGYRDEKAGWDKIQQWGFPFLQKPYSLSDLLKTTKKALKEKL